MKRAFDIGFEAVMSQLAELNKRTLSLEKCLTETRLHCGDRFTHIERALCTLEEKVRVVSGNLDEDSTPADLATAEIMQEIQDLRSFTRFLDGRFRPVEELVAEVEAKQIDLISRVAQIAAAQTDMIVEDPADATVSIYDDGPVGSRLPSAMSRTADGSYKTSSILRASSKGHFTMDVVFDRRVYNSQVSLVAVPLEVKDASEITVVLSNVSGAHTTRLKGNLLPMPCAYSVLITTDTLIIPKDNLAHDATPKIVRRFPVVFVKANWDTGSAVMKDGLKLSHGAKVPVGAALQILRPRGVDIVVTSCLAGIDAEHSATDYGHLIAVRDGVEHLIFTAPGQFRVGFLDAASVKYDTLRSSEVGLLLNVEMAAPECVL